MKCYFLVFLSLLRRITERIGLLSVDAYDEQDQSIIEVDVLQCNRQKI